MQTLTSNSSHLFKMRVGHFSYCKHLDSEQGINNRVVGSFDVAQVKRQWRYIVQLLTFMIHQLGWGRMSFNTQRIGSAHPWDGGRVRVASRTTSSSLRKVFNGVSDDLSYLRNKLPCFNTTITTKYMTKLEKAVVEWREPKNSFHECGYPLLWSPCSFWW